MNITLERNKQQDRESVNFGKRYETRYCRKKSRSTLEVDGSQQEFYDYL